MVVKDKLKVNLWDIEKELQEWFLRLFSKCKYPPDTLGKKIIIPLNYYKGEKMIEPYRNDKSLRYKNNDIILVIQEILQTLEIISKQLKEMNKISKQLEEMNMKLGRL